MTQFQSDLAESHNNIGLLQRATGHPDLAMESYSKSLSIFERFVRDHPESPDHASNLGGTLSNMAQVDLGLKHFDQARDKLRRAVTWQKKALAASPTHPKFRQFMRIHLKNLIIAVKALGEADEARTAQQELDELTATNAGKVK